MNCYKCDTELLDGWNYCPNCKRKIKKNNKVKEEKFVQCDEHGKCHKCSCELNDNWNFCPICGTSVEFYSDKPHISVPIIAASADVVTSSDNVVEMQEQVEEGSNVTMNEKENVVLYNNEVLCPKCGAIVSEAHLFCSVCGTPMKQDNIVTTNTSNAMDKGTVYVTSAQKDLGVNNVNEVNNDDKGYIPWILVGYLGGPCGFLLSFLGFHSFILGVLMSLISVIYAKAKYSDVPIVKFTFWFILIVYALLLVAFFVLMYILIAACNSAMNSCG